MAIIRVTWRCGHEENIRARAHSGDYWQHRGETEDCRDCWREAQNTAAAEAAQAQGLPTLTGTPAQVAWAEALRQAMLKQVAEHEAKIPPTDPHRGDWDRLVRKLLAQTSASWWIDGRGQTVLQVFRRWEDERRRGAQPQPVAELLGHAPPAPAPAPRPPVGFQPPAPPEEERLAARDETYQPVAGYRPENRRPIQID